MKVSTRGQYGVRALLDIALHSNGNPVLLKDIADRQGIPLQYLHQLVTPLIKAGLLRSIRGAHGGVNLTECPEEIKLGKVIQILEGSIAPVKCVEDPSLCSRSDYCVAREVWDEMNKAMLQVLESINLQDLANRHRQKDQQRNVMYHI